MTICICGGGNLGHVCIGVLSCLPEVEVNLLTTHPERWGGDVEVVDPDGKIYQGKISKVSSDPSQVIPQADMVLLCLPGYAIKETLKTIAPHLQPLTPVGSVVSSTGFFFFAHEHLKPSAPLFGFQRVPYICRIVDYGHKAQLKGYKQELKVAIEAADDAQALAGLLGRLFSTPVDLLSSHYEVSLSNSNPLLHPARLYDLWHDYVPGTIYGQVPQFYAEWTERASELYMAMDDELQVLLTRLPVRSGAIMPVLDYYESHDVRSLTAKIRSITAFQGIKAPMRPTKGGFEPDLSSRYFTEDLPYGMRFIVETAKEKEVAVPTINKVYEWGMSLIARPSTS